MKRQSWLAILVLIATFVLMTNLIGEVYAQSEIYVDAVNGDNTTADGSAEKPYKSITFALAKSERDGLPDPWHVHVRPGIYDADPAKDAINREIFPIKLRDGMILEGTTSADACIIDGQHFFGSTVPILEGIGVSSIVIRNLTLQNMRRTSGKGGAIYLESASGSMEGLIEGCVIHNNFRGGLVISGRAFIGNLIKNTFSDNSANHLRGGGGFMIDGRFIGDVSENTFSDNSANFSIGGGGFTVDGHFNGDVSENTFSGNSSSPGLGRFSTGSIHGGGGFRISESFTGDVSENTFSSNSEDRSGGGFWIGVFRGNVSGNIFSSNFAGGGGGGFSVGVFEGDVSENTFSSNSAGGSNSAGRFGGGFYVRVFEGDVSENTFSSNSADQSGGGFNVIQSFTGDVLGNVFGDNSVLNSKGHTKESGGGFSVGEFEGNVSENTFTDNSVNDGNGGGFFARGNFTGDVLGNVFGGNSVRSSTGSISGTGGGFYVSGSFIGDVSENTFSSNSGRGSGGGFFALGSFTGDVSGNDFSNNSTHGFTVRLFEGDVSKNTFTGNSSGGFRISELLDGNVSKNTFTGNSASRSSGGGFSVSVFDGNVSENTFTDNSARLGGGFWIGGFEGDVSGNTFTGNSASRSSGGGFSVSGFEGDVSENTFTGNSAILGGGFRIGGFEGDVSGNTFTGNSATGDSVNSGIGGGFYISESFTGNVLGNVFGDNSAGSEGDGGGFYARGSFTGNVSENTFTGNSAGSGGGFNIRESFIGDVSGNTFTGNSANSGSGGGFSVGGEGLVKVINNNFTYNVLTSSNIVASGGSAVDTGVACTFLNNLFLNGENTTSSTVRLSSDQCRFHNNVFSGSHTAIQMTGEFDIPITHNVFHGITKDIVKRGNIEMGNALLFVELLLTEIHDNIDLDPMFVGEAIASGTWTSDPTYDLALNETIFTDANVAWGPGALVGALVNGFPILGNTATTMRVRGNVGEIIGNDYVIDDYRLQSGSPAIDAGDDENAPPIDFIGFPRPLGLHTDIGPYEFNQEVIVDHGDPPPTPWDVNFDGIVNIFDLVQVASQFGQQGESLEGDVNFDGIVNIFDLVTVGSHFGESVAAAPSFIDVRQMTKELSAPNHGRIHRALIELEAMVNPPQGAKIALEFLRAWLTSTNSTITETEVLSNYPNPFNPETWIPYQLAAEADVEISIYSADGHQVRTLRLGTQPSGTYITKEKAAYWDGRNDTGEQVSSGTYFYRFRAGDYYATKKMIILK